MQVRDKLFQAFAGSTRVGGTGLGLAIARDLLRGHGGDIELLRSAETGTVFRIRLQASELAPPSDQKPAAGKVSVDA